MKTSCPGAGRPTAGRDDYDGRMTSADEAPLIDAELLDRLLHGDEPISAEALSEQVHRRLSAREVMSEIARMQAAGCEIENHPQRGLRLQRCSLECWADYLRWRDRRQGVTGRIIQVFRRTASTQDLVRRIVEAGGSEADGATVIADEQTAGRGRLGRRWVAPPGTAVLMTRASVRALANRGDRSPKARSDASPMSADRVMFAAAVGVARAIEAATGPHPLEVRIKWPNDLLVGEGKIAGILVETFAPGSVAAPGAGSRKGGNESLSAALIGVGVNVLVRPEHMPADDPALRRRVTSLAMQGRAVERLNVAACLMQALDQTLNHTPTAALLDEWRRRSNILAQRLRLRSDGRVIEGQVVDLDPHEGLIFRTDGGELLHLNAATTTVL